ncbi:hypothetical protein MOQ72_20025 [Saccharopolyspora sp. K220]|uniref:hypothetical protein n=1 Tax=Saccharopolyspora soli TaxID=2926618 RepID=UPI001F56592E|nr:hypothetical protein [Saccharopolyspora soli]MCI2419738.1 hypothetical protein [Saccharopolyspora soli]
MTSTISPADALRTLGVAQDTYGRTVNTARSPGHVDVLGEVLAEALRTAQPDTLVVWNTSDEAVLVHAVAHYLRAGVSRVAELEGIVSVDEAVTSGARIALLATQWSERRLATLRRVVSGAGAETVAVAAVLPSEALAAVTDVRTVALLSADETKEFTR